ncbi:hypothetical protein GCM10009555_017300 [Acrocarpospora macrocephala]|uniref:Uncharacterized protein n=1 Tax=Acrocarpospora macrocephala TaxID=150177 RepID=A0A5M3WGH2_9ACTN|nr:hypothetical protein [Acrocarpospora macrocephala]GES07390.1 hypothetical protein Amac_009850 [Acrocarpospora macrocephala]
MPASYRSASQLAYLGDNPVLARPPGIQAGDLLLVVHFADLGGLGDMTISGGAPWPTPIATRTAEVGGGGTKIYRRYAGTDEPDFYTLTQSASPLELADSTIVMIAVKDASANGIVIEQTGGGSFGPPIGSVTTPAATPPTASSLEIRVAIGFPINAFPPQGLTPVTWSAIPGFSVKANPQSRNYVAMQVATRDLVSSERVGEKTTSPTPGVFGYHGFTIIVPSAESSAPTPPPIPPFTPGRGVSPYRYTVHDMATGTYKADITPRDVTFDRRIGEPGLFSGTLDVPNRRKAAKIAKVIPPKSDDLTSGPGMIAIYIWRGGAMWGIYWIHGARIQRSRRGAVTITLRGSTLDAYLLHVTVSEDVEFTGEQIANARALLTHLQADPTANIGLSLMAGSSGTPSRTLTVKEGDDKSYGDALWSYSKAYGGFEWTIDPQITGNTVSRNWIWGYPRIEGDTVHTFQESPTGGDIVEWGEEIDALRGGTRVKVRGGTPEATDATEGSVPRVSAWISATAHLLAGWLRIDRLVDHPGQSTDTTQLDDYATRWVATFAGAVRVYSCTVLLGKTPSISPSSLGDQVKRVMVNPWHGRTNGAAGFNMSQRLIGIAITPISRTTGKEEAQLILEEPTVD